MDHAKLAASQMGNYTVKADKPPQPAINGLYEAMKAMREAAAQARNMADALCGSQPESVNGDAAAQSASLFGQIEDVSGELRTMANRVISDMQRIQNRL